jgi:excisionase family DNA binding protein
MSAVAVAVSPELLTVRQVSAILGCSPSHVYRLADSGQMPSPVHLGALVRWRAAEIDAWISGGCRPVTESTGQEASHV